MNVSAEKSQQTADRMVKVAPGVIAGLAIEQKRPEYPAEAKANHIEGAVVLRALISKEGTVKNLQVVSGPKELFVSAIDAVKEWRYRPYVLNGEPTEVETTITVNYHAGK
jgi:protein TonB